jgi:hypothetical protein
LNWVDSGRFHVDEEKQTRTHSMFVSLFHSQLDRPNTTAGGHNRRQLLAVGYNGTDPIPWQTVNSVLTWRRAEPNQPAQ